MKINITIDLADTLSKPVVDWGTKDAQVIDQAQANLPRKQVVLPKDEAMIEPGQNAKYVKYTIKKGDTLKSIAEQFSVSYGELSNHLMNKEGTTSIHEGQEITIPRHFIDFTQAA